MGAFPLMALGRGAVGFGAELTPFRGTFGGGGESGTVRITVSLLRSFELGIVSFYRETISKIVTSLTS